MKLDGGSLITNMVFQTKEDCAEACRVKYPEGCRAAVWYESNKQCWLHDDKVDVDIEETKIEDSSATTILMKPCIQGNTEDMSYSG